MPVTRRLLTLGAALSVACAGTPPAVVRPAPPIPLREGDVYLCNAPGAPAFRVRTAAAPSVQVSTPAGEVEASCFLLAVP